MPPQEENPKKYLFELLIGLYYLYFVLLQNAVSNVCLEIRLKNSLELFVRSCQNHNDVAYTSTFDNRFFGEYPSRKMWVILRNVTGNHFIL